MSVRRPRWNSEVRGAFLRSPERGIVVDPSAEVHFPTVRVSWTVKQNQNGSYDIHKDGVLLQRKVPFEKLQSAMDPHYVRGEDWKNLLRQLETNRQGTVVIDPWPPAKLI